MTISSDAIYGIEKQGQDIIEVVQLDLNRESFNKSNISQKDFSELCLELK